MLVMWAALVAVAGEAEAEQYRLREELSSLAEKNAWSGVERTYEALEALGLPLSLEDMTLGALAARNEGNMLAALERLQRAVQLAPADADTTAYAEAQAAIDDLKARYFPKLSSSAWRPCAKRSPRFCWAAFRSSVSGHSSVTSGAGTSGRISADARSAKLENAAMSRIVRSSYGTSAAGSS